MTASEKRQAVIDKYAEIIGRNIYSQSLRDYCYKKYKDGKYYSDCSSSVSYAYREALGSANSFGILNTAGMYNATGSKFTQVPVIIKNGQITNPEILRIGDLLLYAGTDNSRPGCVGHVEMLATIVKGANGANSTYYLFGHGSGNPKKTEMVSKNKSRFNSKTSTRVGNKGLIRVIRFIQDDDKGTITPAETPANGIKIKDGTWNVRSGPSTNYPEVGFVKGGSTVKPVSTDGWTFINIGDQVGWISNKALEV